MTSLQTTSPTVAGLDLERETDARLFELLKFYTNELAQSVYALARVWGELARRGHDLTPYCIGVCRYIPLVAKGALLPRILSMFSDRPAVIALAAALPVADQERIVAGESFPLAVREAGKVTIRMFPLSVLNLQQMKQLISTTDRRVRSETEQIAILEREARPALQSKSPTVKRGTVVVDRATETVKIGRSTATVAEVLDAIRAAGYA